MGLYILLMFSSFLALLVTIILYFSRFFGFIICLRKIRLRSLEDIWYSTEKRFLSVAKLGITLHLPCADSPYWAIITVDDLEYKDAGTHVSLHRGEAKLWVFPVLFRFTAGPWIAVTFDGFVVHVNKSWNSPWWVVGVRRNLMTTIVHGETIRLNHSDTKVYLNALTKPVDENTEKDERAGLGADEERDELRLRSSLSQWHILAPWHSRMYSFDDLQVEIRRNWAENRGSFVMIAKECRWTKVPVRGQQEGYRNASTLWQLLHALYSLPLNVLDVCKDPLSIIDVYAPRTDITFGDFRLRDAELFYHGATKVKDEYCKLETRYPGIVENFAWDIFVYGVLSTFQDCSH